MMKYVRRTRLGYYNGTNIYIKMVSNGQFITFIVAWAGQLVIWHSDVYYDCHCNALHGDSSSSNSRYYSFRAIPLVLRMCLMKKRISLSETTYARVREYIYKAEI